LRLAPRPLDRPPRLELRELDRLDRLDRLERLGRLARLELLHSELRRPRRTLPPET